jgi:hypothetical protein
MFLLYFYAHTHTHVVDHVLNSDLHNIQFAPGFRQPNCCVRRSVSVMLLSLFDCHEYRRREDRTVCEFNKITFTFASETAGHIKGKGRRCQVRCWQSCCFKRLNPRLHLRAVTYCGPDKLHWQSCLLLLDKQLLTPKLEKQLLYSVTSHWDAWHPIQHSSVLWEI